MEVQTTRLYVPSTVGQVWLASRLLNRQVVNAATLEPVGRIQDVVFDPKTCRVAALHIQSTLPVETGWMGFARRTLGRSRSVGYVTLDHIVSLNGDVIVVDADPGHVASHQLARMAHLREVCELAIITLHGVCLGTFADLLVDDRGSRVIGYVVNPAKQAEDFMMPLDEIELALHPFGESESAEDTTGEVGADGAMTPDDGSGSDDAAPTQAATGVALSHLRIIPASTPLRIGDTLIMVFEDIEPLAKEAVVITSQVTSPEMSTPQASTPQASTPQVSTPQVVVPQP